MEDLLKTLRDAANEFGAKHKAHMQSQMAKQQADTAAARHAALRRLHQTAAAASGQPGRAQALAYAGGADGAVSSAAAPAAAAHQQQPQQAAAKHLSTQTFESSWSFSWRLSDFSGRIPLPFVSK